MTFLKNKLWLSKIQSSQIISEIERYSPFETGGVLMGYTATNGDVVVTNIIEAGPKAKRSKTSFLPDQEFQLEAISDLFIKSSGSINYLGDWHSHPSSKPDLSTKDKRTLTKIAVTKESNCKHPVMVIYGSKPKRWTVNAVQFIKKCKKPVWPFFKCEYIELEVTLD